MTRSSALVFVALAALPATSPAQATRVRDSAGVKIVENPSVATASIRFRLADKPDVVIGGIRDNAQDELSTRNSWPTMARLAGGRFVVGDVTQIKVFDTHGVAIKVMGRAGAGPGEFRQLQTVCVFRGDSIMAWDVGNRRISIWSPDGKLVREFQPSGFAHSETCLSDGTFVTDGERVESGREEMPLMKYLVLSSTGVSKGTLGPLPATFYSGGAFRDVKFGYFGERIYFGAAIETSIDALDRSGRLLEIVRTSDAPSPMTVEAQGCALDRATKTCTPTPTKMPTIPAFRRMLVSGEGRIWLAVHSDRDSVWTAFGPDGHLLGKLIVPQGPKDSRPRIVSFGTGEVTIADADPDGATRLSLFKLLPVR